MPLAWDVGERAGGEAREEAQQVRLARRVPREDVPPEEPRINSIENAV